MPQTNKLRRSKKSSKKTGWAHHKMSVTDIAKGVGTALSQIKHLAGIINAEKKFHDAQVSAPFDYTGAVNCLTLVPGGSGPNERNGNSIFMKGVLIRGDIVLNPSATNTSVRFIVFQDTSPNPGTVTTSLVLNEVGSGYAPYSGINDENRRRFKILSTKLVSLNSAGESSIPLKTYISMATHSRWNSSTATDLDKGHIYTLVVSNQPTNSPTCSYQSRMYYYDN